MELFNDYKNRYYRCIQNIINEIYNGKKYTKKDIRKILQDAYLEQEFVLVNEFVNGEFFEFEDEFAKLRIDSNIPIRLNDLEIAYLKMFVEDEEFNKVLDEEILTKLKQKLDKIDSLNYNQYWKRENIDKFGDNLDNLEFRNKIIILAKAILNNKFIKYSSKNRKGDVFEDKIAYPYKIEYSIKNNKYRLIVFCDDRAIKINIESITKVEILEDKDFSSMDKSNLQNKKIKEFINNKKNIDKPIVLKIEDNKNTLDRCFNLFSAYDKRYYYDDNNLILNIYYHDFDEAEIVRDILSLGKSVIVLEPKKIRDKVVNRILRNFDR